jgi:hypothetical protein
MTLRAALTTRKRSLPLLTEPTAVSRLLAELSSMPTGESAKPAANLNKVAEIRSRRLSRTRGYFLRDSNGSDVHNDMQFVSKVREALAAG